MQAGLSSPAFFVHGARATAACAPLMPTLGTLLADTKTMIVVVMGVAGSGKTLVGSELARTLGWRFIEGDEIHPPENVAKMRSGVPLTDADREPWLNALREEIVVADRRNENVVLACSALRRTFRKQLRSGIRALRFVYLRADVALVTKRIGQRVGHFMPVILAESQFAALEEPEDAIVLDAAEAPALLVRRIIQQIGANS